MDYFFKKRVSSTILILFSTVVVGSLYQNCAKLTLTDLDAEAKAAEAERVALGKDDELLTAGVSGVPDLKMFFVVDNSGTMSENQLNLASSFGSLFDSASSESLAKFDTTAVLVSTAQRSPSFSSERTLLDTIVAQQSAFSPDMLIDANTMNSSVRSSTLNSGMIPGDNLGFYLKKTSTPLSYTFMPAPVLGYDPVGNGLLPYIHKTASQNSAVMEQDFKYRLALLNSRRIKLVQAGAEVRPEHYSIVDTESGLCSVARILRNSDKFMKTGDLLSFTVVSDENDNDPNGYNCIQNVTEFTGNEDLVDGSCVKRQTTLKYRLTTTTQGASSCTMNGSNGYTFKFTYKIPQTDVTFKAKATSARTDITYRAVSSSMRTEVSYKAVDKAAYYNAVYSKLKYMKSVFSYKMKTTTVNYFVDVKTCKDIISDGIVIGKDCVTNQVAKSKSASGNFVANCSAFAQQQDSQAIVRAGFMPSCTYSEVSVASCNAGTDPNCLKIDNPVASSEILVLGDLYSPGNESTCLNEAKKYADYSPNTAATCTNGNRAQASCSPAEVAAGCTLVPETTKTVTATVASNQTADGCVAWAKTQAYNRVNSAADISKCAFSPEVTAMVSGSSSNNETGDGCLAWAKAQSNNRVTSAADITKCVYVPETTMMASATANSDETADGCLSWAQKQSNHRVTSVSDISKCTLKFVDGTKTGTLTFQEAQSADGGVTIANGADCGSVKSLALAKIVGSTPQANMTSACVITGFTPMTQKTENLAAGQTSCTAAINQYCSSGAGRSCTGTYNSGTPGSSTGSFTDLMTVEEDISCNSKCSDSAFNICGSQSSSDTLIKDYISSVFGGANVTVACDQVVSQVPNSAVTAQRVTVGREAATCAAMSNGPRYFVKSNGPYRLKTVSTDYVAGTIVDEATGLTRPKMTLIDYIRTRSQELSSITPIFTALVQLSSGAEPSIGSKGVAYEQLIASTNGQLGDIKANDYSFTLRDLGKILKSKLERSFVTKKMRGNQIVTKVSIIRKGTTQEVELNKADWLQNGASIKISDTFEFVDGDQFKVYFQNFIR